MTVRIKKSTGAPVVFGADTEESPRHERRSPAPGAAPPKRSGAKKPSRESAVAVARSKVPKPAEAKRSARRKPKPGKPGEKKPAPEKARRGERGALTLPAKGRQEEPKKARGKKRRQEPAAKKAGQGTLLESPGAVKAVPEGPGPQKPGQKPNVHPSTAKPRAGRAAGAARSQAPGGRRASAETLASRQREISVSEFFTKNRHLLGFDSPARALLTTVKEAVDNSLDAAEEAGILPSVRVQLLEISEDRYRVMVQDNGPGIVKAQVPKIFGKLLYGSKFHRLKMARGQQGIGISAAGMYGQLTTGKPVVITSKTGKGKPAHHFEIVIDTTKNAPVVVKDDTLEWEPDHGTRLEIELLGTYKGGRRSVDEYLEQVALANPHAEIFYTPPRDRPPVHLERLSAELPPEPQEIQPHPYGVELGALQQLLKDTKARTLSAALQTEFSRVSPKVASEILGLAGLAPSRRPHELKPGEVELLHRSIPKVKILAPPASCVVPIGEGLIQRGLEREIRAEFTCSSTRPPAVYRGNPFIVEAGLAYGGDLRQASDDDSELLATAKAEDAQQGPITLLRLANRVPLQYQQSACAIFRAAVETNWRQYGLSQPKSSLPQGPMVLLVHLASVWVPFTSESKEAVAHYPEILKEIRLALLECGRKLGAYLRRREHARREERRRSIFEMYIGELVESLGKLTQADRKKLQAELLKLARQHTGDAGEAAAPYLAPARRVRVESPAEPRDDDDERAQLRLGLEESG